MNLNYSKDINRITYNNIGHVDSILFENNAKVAYTYALNGEKLKVAHWTDMASAASANGSTTGGILNPSLPSRSLRTTEYIGGDVEVEGESFIYGNTYKYYFGDGYVRFYPGSTRAPEYYYYSKDHLGNVRSVVTKNPSTNEIVEVQQTHYYPFGGIIADISSGTSVQNKLYNGKELDTSNNLWWYDYGARQYDPTAPRFTTPDPLAEKYYGWNMHGYCLNNPIRFIDPDGKRVVADLNSQSNIYLTLNATERNYIEFKDGVLNYELLSNCNSNSANITALKALAVSDIMYCFQVSDEHFGTSFYDKGDNPNHPSNYSYGVTHLPMAENDPSPDENVYIFTASFLDKGKQIQNTAHEGYGHAYYYELSRKDSSINPSHTKDIIGYYEEEYQGTTYKMPMWGQSNKALEEQIQIVEKEAIHNYENY